MNPCTESETYGPGEGFKLKKNMDFTSWDPLVGNIAIWQLVSFCISVVVAVMCLLSLYAGALVTMLMLRPISLNAPNTHVLFVL